MAPVALSVAAGIACVWHLPQTCAAERRELPIAQASDVEVKCSLVGGYTQYQGYPLVASVEIRNISRHSRRVPIIDSNSRALTFHLEEKRSSELADPRKWSGNKETWWCLHGSHGILPLKYRDLPPGAALGWLQPLSDIMMPTPSPRAGPCWVSVEYELKYGRQAPSKRYAFEVQEVPIALSTARVVRGIRSMRAGSPDIAVVAYLAKHGGATGATTLTNLLSDAPTPLALYLVGALATAPGDQVTAMLVTLGRNREKPDEVRNAAFWATERRKGKKAE